MRLHLLGLPHTETTREFEFCAYTAKTRKLATMLARRGVEVILYAGEANEAEVAEHVTIVSRADQAEWFGWWDRRAEAFNAFDPRSAWWQNTNVRAAAALRERVQPGDVVGFTMGTAQEQAWVALGHPELLPVEVGVGYSGVWSPYRVYESWAWRHYLAGRQPGSTDDVRFYDEVIPNFFEPEAFPAGAGDGGYFLYLGRMTSRKGPQIAAEACKRLGARLVLAGQGGQALPDGRVRTADGLALEGDLEYVGLVGPEERAQLLGGAAAVFVPTMYLEPFGGVSVEAQLAGTPAIVSAWGGLIENVEHGATGYACRTLAEFVAAAEAAPSLDRAAIREHAQATWSCEVLAQRYLDYFDRLASLYDRGWYS